MAQNFKTNIFIVMILSNIKLKQDNLCVEVDTDKPLYSDTHRETKKGHYIEFLIM